MVFCLHTIQAIVCIVFRGLSAYYSGNRLHSIRANLYLLPPYLYIVNYKKVYNYISTKIQSVSQKVFCTEIIKGQQIELKTAHTWGGIYVKWYIRYYLCDTLKYQCKI